MKLGIIEDVFVAALFEWHTEFSDIYVRWVSGVKILLDLEVGIVDVNTRDFYVI